MFLKLYKMVGGHAIVVNMDTVKHICWQKNPYGKHDPQGSKLTFIDDTDEVVVENPDAILSRLEVQ